MKHTDRQTDKHGTDGRTDTFRRLVPRLRMALRSKNVCPGCQAAAATADVNKLFTLLAYK